MTIDRPILNVLFVCTGNSARSILAESILNHPAIGQGRFRAFSAGSHPAGRVQPLALALLAQYHYPTAGLRSKNWDEFSSPSAPQLDFVFTVCDSAAAEPCPIWPGQPMTAHWGIEDPAAVEGPDIEKEKAFVAAFKKMWGEKTVIGDVTQAAYLGPWLWKLTVEKAGSFDIDKIAAASPGVEFKGAPEGYVRIHENHHLWSKTRVGRAKADGQYELIYETADLVEPDPFPKGYQ